jgi:transcriptional regulator with XRE-family HTH domain
MTPTYAGPEIGRRLASARLRRGLSQATVARLTGVAPSYLSRIETGKVHPTFRTVTRIAAAMQMPLVEIAEPAAMALDDEQVCPVSASGQCLLDLIRAETDRVREDGAESFTPRQIALLRRFAEWLQSASPERQQAMEVLLSDLVRLLDQSGRPGARIPTARPMRPVPPFEPTV